MAEAQGCETVDDLVNIATKQRHDRELNPRPLPREALCQQQVTPTTLSTMSSDKKEYRDMQQSQMV